MMDNLSVSDVVTLTREALQAVAPMLERAGIQHRPVEAMHDSWEDLEAQVFKSVLDEPVELAGADPMAKYGFSLDSYVGQSFVSVQSVDEELLALIRFHSVAESFDTLFVAKVQATTFAVSGTAIVPFVGTRFALCVSRQGKRQSFEYLSY